ncbi:deoxyhypusine synthase [Candidatus Woesearchaeota archaeon]|nr:MAG: deoxyhypusine synthase [Candidatus Woesearchaeota archaeon]
MSKEKNQDKKLYYQVKKSTDLSNLPEIKGYDFENQFDFNDFLESFSTTGIQATNLGEAVHIIRAMIREDAKIYLSFTSNMISSGVREIIKYLVKQKKVHILSTAAGGVEEDVIKSRSPFRLGNFETSGKTLFDAGVGRIGNIFGTNEQYSYFEFFMRKAFDRLREEKEKEGITIVSPSQIIKMFGKILEEEKDYDHESSYIYWAYKNDISVYCPGIVDGAIGDMLYFYKKTHKGFTIDPTLDHEKIIDETMNSSKTGAIVLGGGISKHYILNANIFKEGFDYAVYISTATPYDGSDSGGNEEEAKTWAKIKIDAPHTKVYCDASIAFPLIVAGTFIKIKDKN